MSWASDKIGDSILSANTTSKETFPNISPKPLAAPVSQPIPCPTCRAPIFTRENALQEFERAFLDSRQRVSELEDALTSKAVPHCPLCIGGVGDHLSPTLEHPEPVRTIRELVEVPYDGEGGPLQIERVQAVPDEYRTISIAGVIRDESQPCGWRNARAEKAEEKLAQLQAVPVGEGELPELEVASLVTEVAHYSDVSVRKVRDALLQSSQREQEAVKNRDQWERNSAAENKRAGDALVELRNVKAELARLRSQEGAQPVKSDLERIQGSYSSGEQRYVAPGGEGTKG